MKFRITYNVGEMHFTAEADNLAQAYEYVKAIVTSNKTIFPTKRKRCPGTWKFWQISNVG